MPDTVRLSTDRTVVVDGSYHWRLIATDPPPRAVKVQLVNRAFGVATYGTWYPGSTFTHWAPLPTFAHDAEATCIPGRHCERYSRGLGGCVAGHCYPPAPEVADGMTAEETPQQFWARRACEEIEANNKRWAEHCGTVGVMAAPVPVRLHEGKPRDFGQAQDRYGEHLDRPSGVTGSEQTRKGEPQP